MYTKVHTNLIYDALQREKHEVMPITMEERQWLADIVWRPEAESWLSAATLAKLRGALERSEPSFVIEKQRLPLETIISRADVLLVQKLIEAWTSGKSIDITVHGETRIVRPLRLEYSVADGTFELIAEDRDELLVIPLTDIEYAMVGKRVEDIVTHKAADIDDVLIRIDYDQFHAETRRFTEEKHRVLYLFSCFDKAVRHTDEATEIELRYYTYQEREVKERLLMAAPYVTIIRPLSLRQWLAAEVAAIMAHYEE